MAKKHEFDLIVIGSGIAGTTSALLANGIGKKVLIVEEKKFGGDSANTSDVPLSAFQKLAYSYQTARDSKNFGLRSETISYNYPSIKNFKDEVVSSSFVNTKEFYDEKNIEVLKGRAHFISPSTISVNQKHYSADKFIIATGSKWAIPKIHGLDKIEFLTPATMLNVIRPPRTLFVVGGGKTALELAELFAILGSKVYITEISSRLLPKFDQEVGDFMEDYLTNKYGMVISTSSRALSIEKDGLYKRVKFSHAGIEREVKVEHILIAESQQPETDLGLENAVVKFSKDGVVTDKNLRTSNKNIYAVGNVLGSRFEAHSATLEAKIAISNMFGYVRREIDYSLTPQVVNSLPQIAKVGFDEDDCVRQSIDHKTAIANFSESSIATIEKSIHGFIKLVVNAKKQVIGGVIVGPEAISLAQQINIAIQRKMTASELAEIPQPFLSYGEIITVVCNKF